MVWVLDIIVLGGFRDDECKVFRIQSYIGLQLNFNWEGQVVFISFIRGNLSCGFKWSQQWEIGFYFDLEGGSVQVFDFLVIGRLKKIWKGILEQQDGYNNKFDIQQQQQLYRNIFCRKGKGRCQQVEGFYSLRNRYI